jgi:hypothetical protein
VQSFGNLTASAIAGLLWTLASPRVAFATWPPECCWPWSASWPPVATGLDPRPAARPPTSLASAPYPPVMPGAPYYAEAFSPLPGRCFRMVTRHGGGARPTHCPEPVAWRGSGRAPNGRRCRVETCEVTGRPGRGQQPRRPASRRVEPAGTRVQLHPGRPATRPRRPRVRSSPRQRPQITIQQAAHFRRIKCQVPDLTV